jgi:hypothetical protein
MTYKLMCQILQDFKQTQDHILLVSILQCPAPLNQKHKKCPILSLKATARLFNKNNQDFLIASNQISYIRILPKSHSNEIVLFAYILYINI